MTALTLKNITPKFSKLDLTNQTKEPLTFCIWYKKTLKSSGFPIMAQEVQGRKTVKTLQVDRVNLDNCRIEMKFQNPNTPRDPKASGANTVLLVYPHDQNISLEDICK